MNRLMTDEEFDALSKEQLESAGITVTPGDRESFAAALRHFGVPENLVQDALGMSPDELKELASILKDAYVQGQAGNRPEFV